MLFKQETFTPNMIEIDRNLEKLWLFLVLNMKIVIFGRIFNASNKIKIKSHSMFYVLCFNKSALRL